MKCPTCALDLEVRLAGPIEVDECSRCGGAWFEDDELRKAKDAWDPDLKWMDFELWSDWDSLDLKPKDLKCPSCDRGLVAVLYADKGIEVDCCPSCRGIWLEDGEFASIVDELTAELLNKPISQYVKASLQEAKEILTGPESVYSEWKDFKTVLRLMQYRLLVENPRLSKAISDVQSSTAF
jgi:Zn-finger nucleic acid-binding protein